MAGQTKAAVAAAEAVLQESATAVAKQLQKAIPEAHGMFFKEDAAPAAADLTVEQAAREDAHASEEASGSDSEAEVRLASDSVYLQVA